MYADYAEKVKKFLLDNRENITEALCELIRIPSVKSEPEAEGAPFGKECRRCLDLACKMFEKHGYTVTVPRHGKYGVAEYGEGEKSIGIFVHTDVVPANEAEWQYAKPFEPKIYGDAVIGRGADDNKSGVVMAMFLPELFKAVGFVPKSKIVVFLGTNEESGMKDVEAFVKETKVPNINIVPDGGFPVSLGEKGICRFRYRDPEKLENILSVKGGRAYNIVLDEIASEIKYSDALYAEILERAKKCEKLKTEKCGDVIKVTVKGIAAHAANPDDGENALGIFAKELCDCPSLCENDKKILRKIHALVGSFFGEAAGLASTDPHFGRLTMVNGMADTEDGMPVISFDIRYGTAFGAEELDKRLYESFGKENIEDYENRNGFEIPEDSPTVAAILKAYRDVTGIDGKPFYMNGGTYARYLPCAFSIGTIVYTGSFDVPSLPTGSGRAHQKDEIQVIPRMLMAIEVLFGMISELDEIQKGL